MPRHIPTSQHSITVFVLTVFLQDYISCSSLLYSNICNYFQCFTMSKIPVQGLLVDICFYTVNCIPGRCTFILKKQQRDTPKLITTFISITEAGVPQLKENFKSKHRNLT